jgi:MurNAc alpha-1-phosphate uridylyltransferase
VAGEQIRQFDLAVQFGFACHDGDVSLLHGVGDGQERAQRTKCRAPRDQPGGGNEQHCDQEAANRWTKQGKFQERTIFVSLPIAVLAGGLATRLQPLTERIPKILLEVAGRPFAEHQIELLERNRVTSVVFCLGHLRDQVIAALGDGRRWHMTFRYVSDGPRLAGTGGALLRALPLLGPAFFVMYGDSYLDCDFGAIEACFRASGKAGLMTVYRNDDRWDRSNVEFEDGRIMRYDKVNRDAAMHHIDYGLGILTSGAFDPWAGSDEPFDLATVYQHMIGNQALAGYEVPRRFYEIGSPEGLEETRALLAARQGTQGTTT